MKKPWRFTEYQVRKQTALTYKWSRNKVYFDKKDWNRIQSRNRNQLRLEVNNWIDDAVYQNHHRNDRSWHF